MTPDLDPFVRLVAELHRAGVRFVLIGVGGVNYYARGAGTVFATADRDLYLPPDPANLVAAWGACERLAFELVCGSEELDRPRDLWLAGRVVENRALVRARDGRELEVDLTLVMAGYDFETAWSARRHFAVAGVEIPVARLGHIVRSKAAAGRPKDALFLETHLDALRQLGWQPDDVE